MVREGGRKATALAIMETFHIEHTRSRRPHEMSGGEHNEQPWHVALASGPSIVLLGEPLPGPTIGNSSSLSRQRERLMANSSFRFDLHPDPVLAALDKKSEDK